MTRNSELSKTLAQVKGVYRDLARVNHDVSSLLQSNVETYLQPNNVTYFQDDGTEEKVLNLHGTIATHYLGHTYRILVDIYLLPSYPHCAPVCFLRLGENMYFKENHDGVGSDGKVQLPYLHEWESQSHNLIE